MACSSKHAGFRLAPIPHTRRLSSSSLRRASGSLSTSQIRRCRCRAMSAPAGTDRSNASIPRICISALVRSGCALPWRASRPASERGARSRPYHAPPIRTPSMNGASCCSLAENKVSRIDGVRLTASVVAESSRSGVHFKGCGCPACAARCWHSAVGESKGPASAAAMAVGASSFCTGVRPAVLASNSASTGVSSPGTITPAVESLLPCAPGAFARELRPSTVRGGSGPLCHDGGRYLPARVTLLGSRGASPRGVGHAEAHCRHHSNFPPRSHHLLPAFALVVYSTAVRVHSCLLGIACPMPALESLLFQWVVDGRGAGRGGVPQPMGGNGAHRPRRCEWRPMDADTQIGVELKYMLPYVATEHRGFRCRPRTRP